MNTKQLALYELNKKSTGVAYVLGFLFGGLGIHCWYLSQETHFVFRALVFVIGLFVPPVMVVSAIIYIADFFLTYGWVKEYNKKMLEVYGE
jgi:hypothetical protein